MAELAWAKTNVRLIVMIATDNTVFWIWIWITIYIIIYVCINIKSNSVKVVTDFPNLIAALVLIGIVPITNEWLISFCTIYLNTSEVAQTKKKSCEKNTRALNQSEKVLPTRHAGCWVAKAVLRVLAAQAWLFTLRHTSERHDGCRASLSLLPLHIFTQRDTVVPPV